MKITVIILFVSVFILGSCNHKFYQLDTNIPKATSLIINSNIKNVDKAIYNLYDVENYSNKPEKTKYLTLSYYGKETWKSFNDTGYSISDMTGDTFYYNAKFRSLPQYIKEEPYPYNYILKMLSETPLSYIYYKKGKRCEYWASFVIHLDSLDVNKTKATIYTTKCDITTGTGLGLTSSYFGPMPKSVVVEPDPIIEQDILVSIKNYIERKKTQDEFLPNNNKKYYFKIRKGKVIYTDTIVPLSSNEY